MSFGKMVAQAGHHIKCAAPHERAENCQRDERRASAEVLREQKPKWNADNRCHRERRHDRPHRRAATIVGKHPIGNPPGFAAVFSISGGTALISTALATRFVPCRPM